MVTPIACKHVVELIDEGRVFHMDSGAVWKEQKLNARLVWDTFKLMLFEDVYISYVIYSVNTVHKTDFRW